MPNFYRSIQTSEKYRYFHLNYTKINHSIHLLQVSKSYFN
jgi:hypothetical protein